MQVRAGQPLESNTHRQTKTMGNEASTYDDPEDKFDGIDTLGYRVLGVQPNSPASSAGLVSFFDFLVGCNGRMLLGRSIDEEGNEIDEDDPDYDDVDFPALLRESIGVELDMLVWNIKSQTQRIVKLTPSKDWGGTGLLGVTIRLDDYAEADERLIRVLSVEHNSPAAIAGLEAEADYLLGTTTVSFDTDAALAGVLRQHVDKVVELYVYNTNSDVVRVVTLMPTTSWGGQGLLGAEVGTGYLHRLPHQCRGTLGSSVERKVRTSAVPAAAATAPAPASTSTDAKQSAKEGSQAAADQSQQPKSDGNDKKSCAAADPNTSEGGGDAGLVDLTASGSEPSAEIHLEPQLELEPDPDDPGAHHRSAFAVADLHAAAAAQEQEKKRQEQEEAERAAVVSDSEPDTSTAELPSTEGEAVKESAAEAVAEEPAPSQPIPPPPPPPPPAAAAVDAGVIPPPPPPPPPAMNGMAAPPSFGESLQSSPYVPRKSDADSVPPPPPAIGQFGLPPPPMAVVPDSPEKKSEVDLR